MTSTVKLQPGAPTGHGPGSSPESPGSSPVSGAANRRDVLVHDALERIAHPERIDPVLTSTGIAAWVALALISALVPDNVDLPMSAEGSIERGTPAIVVLGIGGAATWAALWGLSAARGRLGAWAHHHVARGSAWFLGAAVLGLFWEISTAKTSLLSPPYFAAPQQIVDSLWLDRQVLGESIANSLGLLAVGFTVGLVAGLLTGVTIGWFQVANYWVHPFLIFIGPVPALAWVPIVFVLFPTAYSGAVFMIALSVWFPITVLTRAGILGVPRSYFDVAQTLGASTWFLVFRVSLPAALPSIFTGAFMALGSSFVTLTVAENFGVNAGLGWYLNWKKSWGDFAGVYAGIAVLIVICGVLLSLLLRTRSWVLRWEKELTRW